jgi:hypothetical protein
VRVLDFGVAVRECCAFEKSLDISPIALLGVMHLLLQCSLFLLQGAGIYVDRGGEATLTNTDVYENEGALRHSRVCAVAAFGTFPASSSIGTFPASSSIGLLPCYVHSWLAG